MLSFHRGKNSPREKGWRGVRSGRTGLFFFPFQFGRILAILSLEAGREIARRAEANLITNLSYGLVGGLQKLVGALQAELTQQLHRRKCCQCLYLAVELHAADAQLGTDVVHL